ncbi:alpha/beta hydrolase [Latilactobacillus curvatus]|uniref:alpha/beta hydrolase n=1 Tax=Latilactobacillus curvatus TaxID=28038 RepID=UPI000FEC9D66|nr:alpha/beta hydrolase [Latilactobacillus curvatus]MDT3393797.1 alpha/beta hydrolase [Bacillota bacterium]QAR36207.1 alpha/beta hydrolase [Latilactobacillus curvatus]
MQSRQPSYSAGKINARRRNPDLPTGDVHHDANNWFQSSAVEQHPVTFKNIYEMQVTANVFLPKDSAETVFPALIIGAPIGAVKEQAANLYAIKLAEQGFVTVSFDQSAWGGSNGALRNAIAPTLYAENFSAATDYLTTLDCVANDRIGLIAIGSAGGFALNALKIDARIKALATINLTDMGAIVREQRDALGGNALIEESSRSRTLEIAGQATTYAHGVPEELDENATDIEREFYDFYRTQRGAANSTLHPTRTTFTKLLDFYPLRDLETITERAMLFVVGEEAWSRHFSEAAFASANESKQLLTVKAAGHVDLYDRIALIPFSELTQFFTKNL